LPDTIYRKIQIIFIIIIVFAVSVMVFIDYSESAFADCKADFWYPDKPCFDSFIIHQSPLNEESIGEHFFNSFTSRYPDGWKPADRSWTLDDFKLKLPAVLCSEIVVDGKPVYALVKWDSPSVISSVEYTKSEYTKCGKFINPSLESPSSPFVLGDSEPKSPDCVHDREFPDSIAWKYNHAACQLDSYRNKVTGEVKEDYIPKYFDSEIQRIYGYEWSPARDEWYNDSIGYVYPAIICSEIILTEFDLPFIVSMEKPDKYTLQQINFHNFEHNPEDEFDPNTCQKYFSPSLILAKGEQHGIEPLVCGEGDYFDGEVCIVGNPIPSDTFDMGLVILILAIILTIGIISYLVWKYRK